jgi:transcriptional regulator with PAS, ATPase and Fis domain
MEINFDLLPEAIASLAAEEDISYEARQVRAFASIDSPILILGPKCTGKEALARAIHQWSGRPGELIVLNCAAVQPDEILFCLETASTLVLKNVALMPPSVCPELVKRLITYEPSRVRIVATSTVPLDASSAETLTADLVIYLRAIQLTFADLSKDLLFLVSRFLEDANRRYGKRVKIQSSALPNFRYFRTLNDPENVDSLQHLIERTVAIAAPDALITTNEMQVAAARESLPPSLTDPWADLSLEQETILYERRLIRLALEHADGSKRKAARLLSISRQTLSNKIRSRHASLATANIPSKAP